VEDGMVVREQAPKDPTWIRQLSWYDNQHRPRNSKRLFN
jgi:hypothetical protein